MTGAKGWVEFQVDSRHGGKDRRRIELTTGDN